MPEPIRVLLVEDSVDDATRIGKALHDHGFRTELCRVESEPEFREALAARNWDVVLSDYTLPRFDAMKALEILSSAPQDVPFIVVTGTIDEETAVACLKSGANDYVLKENLFRLGPAVEQSLRVFEERRQRRILENQLRQTHKLEAVGALAGGIAHDFNNLLFGIRIFTELTLDRTSEDSFIHENLKEILYAVNRAKDLVDQILSFTRSSEKRFQIISVGDVIKDAMKMLRSVIPATIEIQCELNAREDTVQADRTELHQVLINLCVNAAQAMRSGGGVLGIRLDEQEVSMREIDGAADLDPGRFVRIEVSDTGKGIPAENLDRVFEPFFTTKMISEGTGLGLTIVRSIVQSASGVVRVRSTVGEGSVFTVLLPFTARVSKHDAAAAAAMAAGRERILFVDDEDTLVSMGQQMLESLGYQVVALSSSVEALERFRSAPHAFDLVITDQTMPKLTGDDLSRQLLAARPDIPIILCSGYTDRIDERGALDLGVKRFLRKPTPLKEFARMIREVLEGASRDASAMDERTDERAPNGGRS